MPGWVPFTGLTVVVLCLLLALARLSQAVVDDQPALPPERAGDDVHSTDPQAVSESGADGRGERTPSADPPAAEDWPHGPPTDSGTTAPDTDDVATSVESGQREFTTAALLANVALTQGLFGAIVAAGAWYFEIPLWALGVTETGVGTGLLAVGIGFGFGLLLWLGNELSATLADAVGAAYDESLREMLAPDSAGGWVVLLGVILPVIAVVEELLFRAALIGVPAAGFGTSPWALALVSSAAFAGGHGAQGRVGVAVTGGLGLVLAGGYIFSGSLLVVVVAHYLVNAMEFVVHEGLGAERLF